MVKKIIILIASMFILSSCADNFSSYFKRSANNKIIDSRGFKGGKRKPLYNRKYINTAKRNVEEENFDEDDEYEDDEMPPASALNRQMYREMLRRDGLKRQKRAGSGRYYGSDGDYPSLYAARKSADREALREDELQKELTEIKSMLKEAKKDLAKYKCPASAPPTESSKAQAAAPVKPVKSNKEEKLMRAEEDIR